MAEQRTADRSAAEALAAILAVVCVVAGLLSGRPETAALAAPFAFLAVAGRGTARAGTGIPPAPRMHIMPDERRSPAGSRVRLLVRPSGASEEGSPLLVGTVLAGPSHPAKALVLRDDEECPVLVDAPMSGELDVLTYGSAAFRPDSAGTSSFVPAPPVRISILPPMGPDLAGPPSSRLRGLAGSRVSRRPGDGGELRTIAPLRPGDRLRRIDWRATARRSADQDRLMVRGTFADAEASVFLVVDEGHDLPASTAEWFAAGRPVAEAGSLHHARAAATAVAASYLAGGDRVGLDDLSGSRRALRSATGARQLEQIRTRLAGVTVGPRRRRRRDPAPPPGAFVLVFSAFLDDEPGRLLRRWHAQGHLVAGVDCAPQPRRTESSRAQASAVRLTLLRRRLRLEELLGAGIPVFTAPSIDRHCVPPRAPAAGTTPDPPVGLEVGLRILSRQRRRGAGRSAT